MVGNWRLSLCVVAVSLVVASSAAALGTNSADRLVEESIALNGRDNTTALVIRIV